MQKILNKKFNKKIQDKLNNFFFDEEYHIYTVKELLKIVACNTVVIIFILMASCMN